MIEQRDTTGLPPSTHNKSPPDPVHPVHPVHSAHPHRRPVVPSCRQHREFPALAKPPPASHARAKSRATQTLPTTSPSPKAQPKSPSNPRLRRNNALWKKGRRPQGHPRQLTTHPLPSTPSQLPVPVPHQPPEPAIPPQSSSATTGNRPRKTRRGNGSGLGHHETIINSRRSGLSPPLTQKKIDIVTPQFLKTHTPAGTLTVTAPKADAHASIFL